MAKYEYVLKKEYKPVRLELEQIIKKVQDYVREYFTFQFKLVGSGDKHLITRVKDGNKGFDFDYNLILNSPSANEYWKPKFAKETLIEAFKKAIKGTQYDYPENSTTSITIKVKDRNNSKIIHSCDFAVIYYPTDEDYFKYVRFNKEKNNYTWEVRNCSRNYHDKLEWLKNNVNGYWNAITEEYLKVKEGNKDPNKHSFQLYYETINNLINQFYYQA